MSSLMARQLTGRIATSRITSPIITVPPIARPQATQPISFLAAAAAALWFEPLIANEFQKRTSQDSSPARTSPHIQPQYSSLEQVVIDYDTRQIEKNVARFAEMLFDDSNQTKIPYTELNNFALQLIPDHNTSLSQAQSIKTLETNHTLNKFFNGLRRNSSNLGNWENIYVKAGDHATNELLDGLERAGILKVHAAGLVGMNNETLKLLVKPTRIAQNTFQSHMKSQQDEQAAARFVEVLLDDSSETKIPYKELSAFVLKLIPDHNTSLSQAQSIKTLETNHMLNQFFNGLRRNSSNLGNWGHVYRKLDDHATRDLLAGLEEAGILQVQKLRLIGLNNETLELRVKLTQIAQNTLQNHMTSQQQQNSTQKSLF